MCGIICAASTRDVKSILIDGLKRLEYRGYDSAGIALIDDQQKLHRIRTLGKVHQLEKLVNTTAIFGETGIAHTRWATHGIPSERNAHPLTSGDDIALVHNGIIENHDELKLFLKEKGYDFQSDTDSETVAHLLHFHLKSHPTLLDATQKTVSQLKGAYALGIISARFPGQFIAVRHGCPIVIGLGEQENFAASDPLALLSVTSDFMYLEEGDIAHVTTTSVHLYDAHQKSVKRARHHITSGLEAIEKGSFRHYMCKEIYEQPQAIIFNLEGRLDERKCLDSTFGPSATAIFEKTQHVQIVACGTSYHAALVARYWIESLAGIPCSVEIASEFRYRTVVVPENSLFVTLSQSGETADTLAALRLAKTIGYLSTLTIGNTLESSLVRESDHYFMVRAGIEIGVAATKTFTAQLTALLLLTLALGNHHGLSPDTAQHIISALRHLPNVLEKTLMLDPIIKQLSEQFVDKHHALFLGRGALYPIALEGALKLKEISYIHAEGYPAGELKHGPLALVDKDMPVIAIAPNDALLEKLKSNLHEVRARGGELYVFTDTVKSTDDDIHIIEMPTVDPIVAPIVYTIPLQLLSYHVAIAKGTDVDQPRNLAKSVTVE